MDFPKNAMDSFSDEEVVNGLVESKNIYDDISSLNTNNEVQSKSKFKLCISLATTLDNILDGKVFGVSCSYMDWHNRVKHVRVEKCDYVSCSSRVLNNGISAYIPRDMEILTYAELRKKIDDANNGFHKKAELKTEKYATIRKLFNNHLIYSDKSSKSVDRIKSLISETVDLSVLKSYGVDVSK